MLPSGRSIMTLATRSVVCGLKSAGKRAFTLRTMEQPRGICKLAIFDKTGTLTCFDSMYAQWCEDTAKKLSAAFARDVSADFYDVAKYDPARRKILKGGISENPHSILKLKLAELVSEKYAVQIEEATNTVMANWDQNIDPDDDAIGDYFKPLGDVYGAFGALKDEGIKIAICTADIRRSTEKIMKFLGVSDMVDTMRCGDDKPMIPKPDPHNVYAICADTGVKPANTAVIGDTPTDLKLGRNAKVGTTIGVLCGVGSREDLAPYADHLVQNIDEALPILLQRDEARQRAT